eukprot:GFUD01076753.1.p1 GENE.GFUD01076753.1~~GFUD01076753.1.p1  ORF type:complete len:293 (-),score=49.52 GFUD01076753.1:101-979(-)
MLCLTVLCVLILVNTGCKECPEWLTDYDHGNDNYDSVKKEDCRTTEDVSKWVMDNPSECQRACLSDQYCAGFTYLEDEGLCGLYNSSGVKSGGQKSGHISGLRDSCVSDNSRCFCNGYISESGGGECKKVFDGSLWCYVDKDSSCQDKRTSSSGHPFQWSTDACRPVQIDQDGEVSCSVNTDCPCDKYRQDCYECVEEGGKKKCALSLSDRMKCKAVVSCCVDDQGGNACFSERCVLGGFSLSQTSSITGQSLLSLTSPIQSCPPRTCRRKDKCCRLAVMTSSGRLGCPYRC